jgi:hypothetical protein
MGQLNKDGTLTVNTVRLADYPTPDVVKMDIEGGEELALRGVRTTPQWFISYH